MFNTDGTEQKELKTAITLSGSQPLAVALDGQLLLCHDERVHVRKLVANTTDVKAESVAAAAAASAPTPTPTITIQAMRCSWHPEIQTTFTVPLPQTTKAAKDDACALTSFPRIDVPELARLQLFGPSGVCAGPFRHVYVMDERDRKVFIFGFSL